MAESSITERHLRSASLDNAEGSDGTFLSNIVNTVRESMLVLDSDLRVVTANRAFFEVFRVSSAETLGRFVYELGGGEWNIPELRSLLTQLLPRQSAIEDFEVNYSFPRIGSRMMLLNARTLRQAPALPGLILLAIEDITERHAVQREVKINQQLLQATLASIGDGVITTDREGLVLTLNPVAQQLTGWSEEEAKGKSLPDIFRIVSEQTSLPIPNPALRALAEGRIMGSANHTLLIDKSGNVRSIDDSAAPIRDPDGEVVGSVLVFRDISSQRELERDREHLQEQQSALLASTAEGIYTIDQQARCTLINRAGLNLLGFAEEECVGQNMHQLIHDRHPDGTHSDEADCWILNVLTTGETLQDREDVFWRKNGTPVPVIVSCAPIEIGGTCQGAVIAFSDRSERERLDQEHQDATNRLRLAMEAARVVTWTWRPESDEVSVSENLPAIYGISSIASLNTGMELVIPEDRDRHLETVSQAAAERRGYDSEFRILRPDTGELVWLEERCIASQTGNPPRFSLTGVTLDVTRQRVNQGLLEEAHAQLEQVAVELRRSNEDLSQFAAIAGHDLQTPLRTISAYSSLIKRKLQETLDPDVALYLDFISTASRDMHALINSLLDYAKVEGTHQTASVVNLDEEVRKLLATIQGLIDESQATVILGSLPSVHGNTVQLRQLFQNLIVNAITYRHPVRPPVVHVTVEAGETEWTFIVADNGFGIQEKDLDSIFKPFKRLHGTERPGSGLGLAVCRRIVANHGGDLLVESTPGMSSRFLVRLPKR